MRTFKLQRAQKHVVHILVHSLTLPGELADYRLEGENVLPLPL